MSDLKETTINYIGGDKTFTMFSSEQKWVNKIRNFTEKDSKQYSPDVHITYENDDGSLMAEIPLKWLKVSPPKKVSEEFKKAAGERMRQYQADKNTDK